MPLAVPDPARSPFLELGDFAWWRDAAAILPSRWRPLSEAAVPWGAAKVVTDELGQGCAVWADTTRLGLSFWLGVRRMRRLLASRSKSLALQCLQPHCVTLLRCV